MTFLYYLSDFTGAVKKVVNPQQNKLKIHHLKLLLFINGYYHSKYEFIEISGMGIKHESDRNSCMAAEISREYVLHARYVCKAMRCVQHMPENSGLTRYISDFVRTMIRIFIKHFIRTFVRTHTLSVELLLGSSHCRTQFELQLTS